MCLCIDSKRVTARKPWKCFGCGDRFEAGTVKHNEKTRGDGRLYTLPLCPRCKEAVRLHVHYGDVYSEGEVRELWGPPEA